MKFGVVEEAISLLEDHSPGGAEAVRDLKRHRDVLLAAARLASDRIGHRLRNEAATIWDAKQALDEAIADAKQAPFAQIAACPVFAPPHSPLTGPVIVADEFFVQDAAGGFVSDRDGGNIMEPEINADDAWQGLGGIDDAFATQNNTRRGGGEVEGDGNPAFPEVFGDSLEASIILDGERDFDAGSWPGLNYGIAALRGVKVEGAAVDADGHVPVQATRRGTAGDGFPGFDDDISAEARACFDEVVMGLQVVFGGVDEGFAGGFEGIVVPSVLGDEILDETALRSRQRKNRERETPMNMHEQRTHRTRHGNSTGGRSETTTSGAKRRKHDSEGDECSMTGPLKGAEAALAKTGGEDSIILLLGSGPMGPRPEGHAEWLGPRGATPNIAEARRFTLEECQEYLGGEENAPEGMIPILLAEAEDSVEKVVSYPRGVVALLLHRTPVRGRKDQLIRGDRVRWIGEEGPKEGTVITASPSWPPRNGLVGVQWDGMESEAGYLAKFVVRVLPEGEIPS